MPDEPARVDQFLAMLAAQVAVTLFVFVVTNPRSTQADVVAKRQTDVTGQPVLREVAFPVLLSATLSAFLHLPTLH